MQAPTTNRITQGQHLTSKAVDHSASPDPYIYAPENGRIDSYQYRGLGTNSAGNVLRLSGATGMHSFCHLEESYVAVGSTVVKGQKLAKMGYTGYTIPTGPAGRHLHYYILTPNGYVYPPTLYKDTFTQGDIMDTDQKVANQYYTLRGNAGTATERKAWIGKSYEQFNATARPEVDSREANRRNLENAVKVLTTERDTARVQVATLTKEVLAERDRVQVLQSQNNTLQAEIDGAKQAYKELEAMHNLQIAELNSVIEVKDKEIARLNKELESAGTDCDKLTAWELIALGIKKLFERS